MLRAHTHDMRVSGNMAATCQLRVLPWQVALVYSFHISYWTPVKIWYLLTSIMWSHHMFSFFFQVDLCPSTGFHLNCRLKPDFVAWTQLPSFQNFSLTSHFPLTQFFRCPISSKFPVTYHGVGVDIFQNRTFLWCACHIPLFFSQEIALQRWRRQSKLFCAPSFSVTFPRILMILWDMHFLVWHSFLSGAPLHFCSRHLNPLPFSKYDYRFSTLKHLLFSY